MTRALWASRRAAIIRFSLPSQRTQKPFKSATLSGIFGRGFPLALLKLVQNFPSVGLRFVLADSAELEVPWVNSPRGDAQPPPSRFGLRQTRIHQCMPTPGFYSALDNNPEQPLAGALEACAEILKYVWEGESTNHESRAAAAAQGPSEARTQNFPRVPSQNSSDTDEASSPVFPHSTVSACGEPLPQRTVLPHKTVTPLGSLLLHRGVTPQIAAEFVPDRNAWLP